MIKDSEGAYSQLIRLQEGVKKGEEFTNSEKLEKDSESDKAVTRSSSQRFSIQRSISRGSSGSRRSFALSFSVPEAFGIYEPQTQIEDALEDAEANVEKGKNVSITRLAKLNKPELPVLLLGSFAAAVHGVTFPIFGLLLSSAIKMFYEPPQQLRKDSRFWSLIFVALGVATLLAIPAQNYLFGIAGGKMIRRIRNLTFEKVVHQEISWFDDPKNSRLVPHMVHLGLI